MIITKTPFRMSFFGGGTDMPDYFSKESGAVLSTTFDKYCYVNVRHLPRFFDYTTELTYHNIERVKNIDDIQHPAIRNAMKMLYMHELRLSYEADLPARSGLGTSSSFVVGMLLAFYAMKGQYVDKRRLADEAIYVERVLCGECGGWQDQIAAAFGGLNYIEFEGNSYNVQPVIMPLARKEKLNNNLMLFFTGFTRFSSEMQKMTISERDSKKEEILREMRHLVDEAYHVLVDTRYDLDDFGRMLDYTWQLKRQTGSKVSTNRIDDIYRRGIQAGALGGKLLGAGGGGFMMFYVPEERQEEVRKALSELMYIPFRFETSGTEVVHYTPEDYTSTQRRER